MNKECIICHRTDQPWFSKKRCKSCASKTYAKPVTKSRIIKQTDKNKEQRKEDRADFPEFFARHCAIIKEGKVCENCGSKNLQGISAEVAHILSKNKKSHPEVATNDNNIVYLCFWGGCHTKFDSSLSVRREMPVFKIAAERLKTIRHLIINKTKESQQFEEYWENQKL